MTAPTTKPVLSQHYKITKQHTACYTGGQIQLSYCSRFLLCWCNCDITVVDINTGTVIQRIDSDENDAFITFTLHPNNTTLAVATSPSHLIRIYTIPIQSYYINDSNLLNSDIENIDEPQIVHNGFKPHTTYPVLSMSYDSTGTMLATCSVDRTVRVFSVQQNYSVTHILKQHSSSVQHVWWHPDSTKLQLFSANDSGELLCWSLANSKAIPLNNHMSAVTSISFNSDNTVMYSTGRDKIVSMWNLNDMTLINTILVYEPLECIHTYAHNITIPTVTEPDNTTYIITAGELGQLKLFNTKTRKSVYTYHITNTQHSDKLAATHNITHMLYDTQNNRMIVTTSEHNIYIYDTLPTEYKRHKLLIGYNDEILHITVHPIHKNVIYVVTNSTQIRMYNIDTFDADILVGHTDTVLACDISSDGNWLASVSKDCTLRIWSTHTLQCIAVATGHTADISTVKFSTVRNNELYCYTGGRDCTLKQWNCSALLATDVNSTDAIDILCTHSTVAHTKEINCIAVAPNNSLIATGSQDKVIKLYNTALEQQYELSGHTRGIWSLEFSTIDRVLCSTSSDMTIKLWSLSDYTCIKTLQGHTNNVLQCKFINYGTQLISTGSDSLVKIWSIKTSECIATYDQCDGKVWSLAVINDTTELRTVITGGTDSTLRIWSDITNDVYTTEQAESIAVVQKQQVLQNLIAKQQYGSAFILALELKQPRKLYQLLYALCYSTITDNTMTEQQKSEIQTQTQQNQLILIDILSRLDVDRLNQLLQYILDWNTNSRYYMIAQIILQLIFQLYETQSLLQCTVFRTNLNALILYSEKHYKRLDTLKQKTKLIPLMYRTIQPISATEQLKTLKPVQSLKIEQTLKIENTLQNDDSDISDSEVALIDRIEQKHNKRSASNTQANKNVEKTIVTQNDPNKQSQPRRTKRVRTTVQ